MSAFTYFTGLLGIALAIAATVLVLPGVARIPQRLRIGLVCGIALVSLIPFGGLPFAGYVRGVTGDLSIATQVLLALAILRRAGCVPPACAAMEEAGGRRILLFLVAAAALFLYPMALGWGLFDPYRLGFGSPWLLTALLVLALGAWWRGLQLIALTIALAVLAWSAGWGESANLWDYLLDPLLAVYAITVLLRQGVQALPRRQRGQAPLVRP